MDGFALSRFWAETELERTIRMFHRAQESRRAKFLRQLEIPVVSRDCYH